MQPVPPSNPPPAGAPRVLVVDDDRNYDVFDRSIDVHIWSLRKKLGDDPKNPRFIRTLRAVGYLLINPDAP
jgi:DNA-binding response OmpR family regulator